jgi:CRISPR-associated protein Cas2
MKVRFMRVVVFFDLPVLTKKEIRQYTKFRKYLVSQGFVMVQKSVYSKIALNGSSAGTVLDNLRKNSPNSGVVQVLIVTEKQYQSIEFLVGEAQKETVDTQQRLVVL